MRTELYGLLEVGSSKVNVIETGSVVHRSLKGLKEQKELKFESRLPKHKLGGGKMEEEKSIVMIYRDKWDDGKSHNKRD